MTELLARIDEQQRDILAQGPLSAEIKKKLDYRLRLDWNYHSNVMEGSSLTRLETEDIMLGRAVAKLWKDVKEMKGHDEQIQLLLAMSKGDMELSESRIKSIHAAIVHEDSPELQAQVGQWKQSNNYILNHKGERFDFTPKEDVPEAMHKLLDAIKADVDRIERVAKDATHPVLLASDLHRQMVTIHPFHDGNGRMSRIMSNILLMRLGYTPVLIETGHKDEYNRILAEIQGYGAPEDLFHRFIAERVLESQQLMLDALAGKSLERPDDLDKEVELFKRSLAADEKVDEKKGHFPIQDHLSISFMALALGLTRRLDKMTDLFHDMGYRFLFGKKEGKMHDPYSGRGGLMLSMAQFPESYMAWLERGEADGLTYFAFDCWMSGYKYNLDTQLKLFLLVEFEEYHIYSSYCLIDPRETEDIVKQQSRKSLDRLTYAEQRSTEAGHNHVTLIIRELMDRLKPSHES